ncbi:hypothetical protein LEMLEM_LOCUS11904, partial [Lemmus lemmus]
PSVPHVPTPGDSFVETPGWWQKGRNKANPHLASGRPSYGGSKPGMCTPCREGICSLTWGQKQTGVARLVPGTWSWKRP